MERKNCNGKKRHGNVVDAQIHADSLMDRMAMVKSPIVAFFCDRHDCYHVGHNAKLPTDVARTRSAASWARADLSKKIGSLAEEAELLDILIDLIDGEQV